MNWVFFVKDFVEYTLSRRLAESERVVSVGPGVSFIRSPAAIRLRRRVSKLVDCRFEKHYQPIHFPVRAPVIGSACQILNSFLFRHEMRRLRLDRPDVLCVRGPEQHNLIGLLRESLSVYYVTDDFTVDLMGRPIPAEIDMERRLLAKVDSVICITEELAKRLRERAPHDTRPAFHVMPNFYDERLFDAGTDRLEPAGLHGIPRPRILVAGHISNRIDWEGLIAASSLRPEWSWIFLGRKADSMMEQKIQRLGRKGFLHPKVPSEEVPAWIQHADACAVPYCLNPFTLASDPVKALEYLAMGVPVLSTRVPSLSRFDRAMHWVEEGNAESYAAALDAIGAESGNPELKALRQQSVAAERLQLRAQQFISIIGAQIQA
jgi:glycosyltransferase involved in cell wall biosynthesis